MSASRRTYTVQLGTDEHRVEVGPGDVFRAELEALKNGLPANKEAAMFGHLMVQLWCACVRAGVYGDAFQAFITRDLHDFDGPHEEAPVDPTGEPSASGSSSPTTSPAPPTGSTPTSTPT